MWLLFVTSCSNQTLDDAGIRGDESGSREVTVIETAYQPNLPRGLPPYHVPPNNPMTTEKVELGRRLFFDPQLSVDGSMSCATCHDPEKGWSNGLPVAVGVHGEAGNRNVPSILNAAYYRAQFWDGRAGSLEGQALGPITNPIEMAMPSLQELVTRLNQDESYPSQFAAAFADGLTATNVAKAIASYERTIIAANSPYDRYMAGEKDAMSAAAVRGMELFFDKRKTKCSICHEAPAFTAMFYHNIGVGMDKESPDWGRYEVTKIESNKGKFKVPTVRDLKYTAPYMHDGSIATLEEVVELYDKGGIPNPYLSDEMRSGKLNLSPQEKKDLVTFMVEGLTSDEIPSR
ncbi:MAG: cytochrome c peroxidase [Pirellulaceae bacterium]